MKRFPRSTYVEGVKIPCRGKAWKAARALALTPACEVLNCLIVFTKKLRPQVDHILPEKWLALHGLSDPHRKENLLCCCRSCHAKKKVVEDRLFRGDKVGLLDGLRVLGWPMERVLAILNHYRL